MLVDPCSSHPHCSMASYLGNSQEIFFLLIFSLVFFSLSVYLLFLRELSKYRVPKQYLHTASPPFTFLGEHALNAKLWATLPPPYLREVPHRHPMLNLSESKLLSHLQTCFLVSLHKLLSQNAWGVCAHCPVLFPLHPEVHSLRACPGGTPSCFPLAEPSTGSLLFHLTP